MVLGEPKAPISDLASGDLLSMQPPRHGGDISSAIAQYGGEPSEWLDLSTGIGPISWPVHQFLHHINHKCWQELPCETLQQDTARAAAEYYSHFFSFQSHQCVLAAGSQGLIQLLPTWISRHVFRSEPSQMRVWVTAGSYGEHYYQWRMAGCQVTEVTPDVLASQIQNYAAPDVLILVQPDNPSGHCFSMSQLQEWQAWLKQSDGVLVLDAAFIDAQPVFESAMALTDNCIVLTSLGKFFGLAGLRIGTAWVAQRWADSLRLQLGPWPVSGLSLWLATQALLDTQWQQQQQDFLQQQMQKLLSACQHLPVLGHTCLFVTLHSKYSSQWQRQLAQQKIWTRCFEQQQLLRIGLTADDRSAQTVHQALSKLS